MSAIICQTIKFSKGRSFSLVVGNLLDEPVETIVNAANGHLAHGGGVAAAIARAAGAELIHESHRRISELGPISTGEAVVTTAGNLPFKGVIHAVGPQLGDGNEEEKLTRAIKNALTRAEEQHWSSLAFPAISSGIFRIPLEICARSYLSGVRDFFENHPDSILKTVHLCVFEGPIVEHVLREMNR